MLSLLKKKPTLSSLIPNGFVDIHSHILPGIDDGAKDATATNELLTGMQELGFAQIIGTPHIMSQVWPNTAETIQSAHQEAEKTLVNNQIPLQIKAAAEYLMDESFGSLIDEKRLLTLKDNIVLVEMSYLNPPIQLFHILFELQVAGYEPLLAHPERYAFYFDNFKTLKKLKDVGCKFQLNLLSVVGYYGGGSARMADQLLKEGMIDYVGSDIHHNKHIASFGNKILVKHQKELEEAIARNDVFRF